MRFIDNLIWKIRIKLFKKDKNFDARIKQMDVMFNKPDSKNPYAYKRIICTGNGCCGC